MVIIMKSLILCFLMLFIPVLALASVSCGEDEGSTFYIAAYNTPDELKKDADFVCDGIDDQVEIQMAINSVNDEFESTIYLLQGDFILSNALIINKDNLILEGAGDSETYVTATGPIGSIGHQIFVTGDHTTIRNFHLNGAKGVVKYQIVFTNNQYSKVEHMIIGGSGTDGVVFGPNTKHGILDSTILYSHYNPQNLPDHTSSIEVEDGAEHLIITNNKGEYKWRQR